MLKISICVLSFNYYLNGCKFRVEMFEIIGTFQSLLDCGYLPMGITCDGKIRRYFEFYSVIVSR